jgi:serine/threonine protein kinase
MDEQLSEDAVFRVAFGIESPKLREEYLRQVSLGKPALYDRVNALLKASSEEPDFLESPATGVGATVDLDLPPEQVGDNIGPYKLVEELGEGGMGSVFMATQKEPVRRRVALKVIKPGMGSKQVVGRFEAERQALAMMDHPSIARVFDGGTTESGRPYFVMELVNGMPVTEYCDRYRFTTEQRLDLFGQVCQAVQHAHRKGIIHRDLKPSNILVTHVDGRAVPKVIDFGIAKATGGQLTEETVVTNLAQMIGTPLYMSPEQTELSSQDIDTRSDVYSLGVVLYELLTGTTPFDRQRISEVSYDEFRRIIREEEPQRPSTRLSTLDAALDTVAGKHHTDARTLSRQVSGELDWIVMKALEKDRTRRYESANELAKDVQRYLDNEAVEACPPSTAYRLRKFARRNKTALATISAVALALVVGAGIATWQSIRATQALHGETAAKNLAKQRLADVDEQRKLAETNFRLAEKNHQLAEKNFQLAFDAVDEMLTEVAGEELVNVPQAEPVRRALLEKALAFYEGFLEDRGNDPQVRQEAGRAHLRVGEVSALLNKHEEAEKALREAIALFEKLTAEFPRQSDHRHSLAESRHKLGGVLGELGRLQQQRETYRQALEIQRPLVAEFPQRREYRNLLGLIYASLGNLHLSTGRIADAEKAYQLGQDTLEQSPADSKPGPDDQASVETIRRAAVSAQIEVGQIKEAERAVRESLKVWKELASQFPESTEYRERLSSTLHRLANVQYDQGQRDQATETARKALHIRRQLVADFPAVPRYRYALAGTLNTYAQSKHRSGEEEACRRESLAILEQLVADYPNVPLYAARVAGCLYNLGNEHKGRGEYEEAEAVYRRGVALSQKAVQALPGVPEHLSLLALHKTGIGMALHAQNRHDEAEASCREAAKTYRELAGKFPRVVDHRADLSFCLWCLGRLLQDMDRLEEAESTLQESVAILQQAAAEVPENSDYRKYLAMFEESLAAVRKAVLAEASQRQEAEKKNGR